MGVQIDKNGLYYIRARYYSTDIKRFINRDVVNGTIANSQSLNRYSYVQGNPVSQTDPFGLSPMGGDIMSILPQLIHTGLAIGGFFWDGFDLINAVYYAAEGNTLMAMSCGVAAIPFLGSVASKGVSKIAFKVLKSADKASDLAKAAKISKAAGYINDISKLVGYTGMATLGAIDTAYAYQDYKAARANGEDATLELCSVILNGAFTACSGIRAVSSAAKVTARLKADGIGDAVKAAAKNAMSSNKGNRSPVTGKGGYNGNLGTGNGFGKLDGLELNVTDKGLDMVKKHIADNGFDAPENTAMIQRLTDSMNAGEKITGADASYYMHELREATLMNNGMEYTAAHEAALKYYKVSPFSVYHPDIIKANPSAWGDNWRKFWGIGR